MQDNNELYKRELISRYLEGKASEQELMVFFGLTARGELDELLMQYIDQDFEAERLAAIVPQEHRKPWRWVPVAAVVLIALLGGTYLWQHHQMGQQVVKNQTHDVAPGRNQATLTLANGRKIILTKGLSGTIAQQGQTTILIKNGKLLVVNSNTHTTSEAVTYLTMTTARGEMSPYPLEMADGTKVWLNAESTITYPNIFNGKDRTVKIAGEAYLEVKHNATQPFRVEVANQVINDIGTIFDVNAYANEPTTYTTLIEGAVSVNGLLLKPGQRTDGKIISKADIETVTAWKFGKFSFDGTKLDDIMRQAARWYDIKVDYDDEVLKSKTFFAVSNRFANVSELLNNLQMTGEVKFKIDGNHIQVSANNNH